MQKTMKLTAMMLFGALAAFAGTDRAHGAVMYSDSAAFDAAMDRVHIDGFDAMVVGDAPNFLTFDGFITADVHASGASENLVVLHADGHGALAADGDRFWKLRGGTTTLTLSGLAVNAFGFFYSDLEQATLRISSVDGVFDPVDLDDDNAGVNRFFGLRADGPIGAVTIKWMSSSGDGVGIDGLRFGHAAVIPAPRSLPLGLAGMAIFAWPRRRA
jgi:hypothetical protein